MRLRCTALAAVAALALGLTAASPATASAARPGDLVATAPSAFHPLPGQPTNTKAWKISYRSTTADGAPDVVSGTVIVPQDGRTGPRPLITYAVGTVGMGDSCAPSNNLPNGTAMEANLIQQLTLRGWAVVVTDYEGLGTPGVHTYTVGPSAGHAMLDAARAACASPRRGCPRTRRSASWATPRAARPAAGPPSCRARTHRSCRSRAPRPAASRPT